MSKFTTGEMAKLCDVSVRTVQFYDTKGLLIPSDLTEGGRRLYSEDDLQKLKSICLFKALGLSLSTIKGIFESENPNKLLMLLLSEQKRQIDKDISQKQKQIDAIEIVIDNIAKTQNVSVNSINDIENIMNGKRKLRKTYVTMVIVATLMTAAEIYTVLLWAMKGIWWPFAICMPLVIIATTLLVKMYYKNTAYICPECGAKFKPKMKEFFWAAHTPRTRKVTCTECGYKGFCAETYAD